MQEEWKDVTGYEGLYQVSNFGNVKSLWFWNGHKYKKRNEPKILRQSNTTTGYKKVELIKNGIKRSLKVHRLVGIAFIPNPDNKKTINHIDFNPKNNKVDNLEWCTHQENIYHSVINNKLGVVKSGELKQQIIKQYVDGVSLNDIQNEFNISLVTMRNILKSKNINPRHFRKYKIEKERFKELLKTDMENKEIAKILGCTKQLVATRRHQVKEGRW